MPHMVCDWGQFALLPPVLNIIVVTCNIPDTQSQAGVRISQNI
jgi:hypothetical protein